MQRNVACNESRIDALLDGCLIASEKRELRVHLVDCRWCRDYLDYVRGLGRAEPDAETKQVLREAKSAGADSDETSIRLLNWMLTKPSSEWAAIVAAHYELRSLVVVRRLVDVIKGCERDLAVRALELATIACDIVTMIPDDSEATLRMRCEVWRKYSTAQYSRGDYPAALDAIRLAETYVGYWPDSDLETAVLRSASVPILRRLGKTAKAHEELAFALEVFRRYDAKSYLAEALYHDATLRFEANQFDDAEQLYMECAERYRFLKNAQMYAAAISSIAWCQAGRGDTKLAAETFNRAEVLYRHAGMRMDAFRITQARGRIALRAGLSDDGLSLLREAEIGFDRLGRGGDAIDVALEIVEALVALGDSWEEVIDRCRKLVPRAKAAGLSRQVATALSNLREAAREHDLSYAFIKKVRRFVRDAPAYPGVEFEANENLN